MHSEVLPNIGETVGNYKVLRRIGAGGMGVVFEALNLDTDGKVALKFLSPELLNNAEAVKRFRLEAKATGRIQHVNVVAVHNVGEHRGQLYLVMEFLRGHSLRDELAKGLLDLPRALEIMFPVLRGVAAAHAVGVLHRDLKPENIFLMDTSDGMPPMPKVLDFGIAKLTSDAEATNASARTAFMGTYQYMAFEQLHARKDLDGRVDVYALGTVLYHVLTGALPYRADNPVDLALAMLQSDPIPANHYTPSLPEGFSEVLGMALARDREQRFADVDSFARALAPFAQAASHGAGDSRPIALGAHAPLPTPFPGGFTPPPRSADSGRVPGVFSSPTPFVVRGEEITQPPQPRKASAGLWLVASIFAVVAVGAAAFLLLRPSTVPPPALPAAPVADPTPPLPTSPVTAPAPKAPAAAMQNDDWGAPASNADTRLEPMRPAEEPLPSEDRPSIDPRAGQPPRAETTHAPSRGATRPQSAERERPVRPRRDVPSSPGSDPGSPRTRSGLGVSSDEF